MCIYCISFKQAEFWPHSCHSIRIRRWHGSNSMQNLVPCGSRQFIDNRWMRELNVPIHSIRHEWAYSNQSHSTVAGNRQPGSDVITGWQAFGPPPFLIFYFLLLVFLCDLFAITVRNSDIDRRPELSIMQRASPCPACTSIVAQMQIISIDASQTRQSLVLSQPCGFEWDEWPLHTQEPFVARASM